MSHTDDELFETVERLLAELAQTDERLRELEVRKDRAISRVKNRYALRIDPLIKRRDELLDVLAELFIKHEKLLTAAHGKTAVFRSGVLSARTSAGSLVVDNEEAAIDKLRVLHKLRAFTRQGKRTLDKQKLKKHPELIAKLPGVRLDVPEFLSVRLARTKAELKQDLHPYRTRVN